MLSPKATAHVNQPDRIRAYPARHLGNRRIQHGAASVSSRRVVRRTAMATTSRYPQQRVDRRASGSVAVRSGIGRGQRRARPARAGRGRAARRGSPRDAACAPVPPRWRAAPRRTHLGRRRRVRTAAMSRRRRSHRNAGTPARGAGPTHGCGASCGRPRASRRLPLARPVPGGTGIQQRCSGISGAPRSGRVDHGAGATGNAAAARLLISAVPASWRALPYAGTCTRSASAARG